MSQLILYIATSLDGFIARPNGEVDWLDKVKHPQGEDYGYYDFYGSIDTVIMGNKTYEAIKGFDVPFPYPDKDCYVCTRNSAHEDNEHVRFVSQAVAETVAGLKEQSSKGVWLVGGGALNHSMLQAGLLDELRVHIMPWILGEGIPLFSSKIDQGLELKSHKVYPSGVIEAVYTPIAAD